MAAPSAAERLREHGMRVTAPRLAVLDVLDDLGGHPDVAAVAAAVRDRLGTVSTQAVYDILRTLNEAGLVRKLEPAGSPARFETRVGDNHHHLICRSCGAAVDVDCVVGDPPCLEPSDAHGFAIDEAEVLFWGHCPDCRAAAAPTAASWTTASGSSSASPPSAVRTPGSRSSCAR
ncbi:MAG: transcriptional repressor, partial [Solirubrobacterales bacterium]|nr:transcriptional repressor [Solirubrobacterales bacterium]